MLPVPWLSYPRRLVCPQNVLVVGNSASGYDVGREIATLFHEKRSKRRVYQSMRHGFEIGIDPSEGVLWSSHLTTLPGIARVTSDKTVEFLDGQKLDFDVIIYATGYLYSFPYYHKQDAPFNRFPLTKTPSLPVQTEGKQESHRRWPCTKQDSIVYPDGGLQVINLDKHYQTFYCPDPTLALICLNKQVIPCKSQSWKRQRVMGNREGLAIQTQNPSLLLYVTRRHSPVSPDSSACRCKVLGR